MNVRITFLLIFLPFLAAAGQIRTGEHIDLNSPTTENTYLAGGHIDLNAAVGGDLTAVGGEIDIRDVLHRDGLIIGGEINIEALTREDLRILGGDITLREPVAGDLLILGGDIHLEAGAEVQGDLIIIGGEVVVDSPVKGNVSISAGQATLNGSIGGRVELSGGQLHLNNHLQAEAVLRARSIQLGENARFYSDVQYWQKDGELDFTPYLMEHARARFDPDLRSELMDVKWEEVREKGMYWMRIFQVVSGLFLMLVLFLVLRRFLNTRTGKGRRLAGVASVYGLAALIGLPLLSILAFGSVVGVPIGVVSLSLFVILVSIANALAALLLAYEWQKANNKSWNDWTTIGVAGSAFLLMRLLAFIPVVGSVINTVLSIWAVGYLLVMLWQRQNPDLPQPSAAEGEDLV